MKIAEDNQICNIYEFQGKIRAFERERLKLRDELVKKLGYTGLNNDKLKNIVSSTKKTNLGRIMRRELERSRSVIVFDLHYHYKFRKARTQMDEK